MSMNPGSSNAAIVESIPETEDATDERSIQLERLQRSVRITAALLRAAANSRKLLKKLSAPFLETADEKDTEKTISARKTRRRDAIFAAAKTALAPDHLIKNSIDELLNTVDDLDPSIGLSAREVKSKVLEELDELINHALNDANEEMSSESVAQFAESAQKLMAEMDLRSQELGSQYKICKAQLRQAWKERLVTTRNILITSVVLLSVAIASVGYVVKTRKQAEVANIATHAPAATEPLKTGSVAIQPKPDVASPQPVQAVVVANPAAAIPNPTPVVPNSPPVSPGPVPAKAADARQAQNAPAIGKIVNGTATLSSGQSREEMKKSVQALGEVIKEWNAENDAQAAREKTQKKPSR